ncbi:MAG TPA: hypothetical protein PKJ08_10635 [Candidatus Cloacimonadota bacterium]|nr:hypothetical protein [Candidatus Cloacimonadota bacterium]
MIRYLIIMMLLPLKLLSVNVDSFYPYVKQNFLFYQSDRVTAGGAGGGIGVRMNYNQNLFSETDICILWGNGNSIPVTCAIGFQANGVWCPAVSLSSSVLLGQRTELLNQEGNLPSPFIYTINLKLQPFRFKHENKNVSFCDLALGMGPYKGNLLSLTMLSMDF